MKKQFLFLLLAVILLSSCATATLSEFPGVGRVKQYDFYSYDLSLIHISEPTRQAEISYAVFCLKKKKTQK